MFLAPPSSIPPRPVIFSRGLSSIKLARRPVPDGSRRRGRSPTAAGCLAAASKYWLATLLASLTSCFWARIAAPRDTDRPVDVVIALPDTDLLFERGCLLGGPCLPTAGRLLLFGFLSIIIFSPF